MNRGKGQIQSRPGGYTIVETLIFLAVTGFMLIGAMVFIGGKQNKAQFVNSVRDFESRLTDIANDVSTGYYQNAGTSFDCVNNSGVPAITSPSASGTVTLGMNSGCIFAGTVVKFGENGNREKFTQLAMAGARYDSTGTNVTTLTAANPRVINSTNVNNLITIPYGASVQCIDIGNICNTPSATTNAAVGFYTKFVGTSAAGGNGIQTDVLLYTLPQLTTSATSAAEITNI